MDLDPASWGGLESGLKIGPVKTSTRPTQYFYFLTLRLWALHGKNRLQKAFIPLNIRRVAELLSLAVHSRSIPVSSLSAEEHRAEVFAETDAGRSEPVRLHLRPQPSVGPRTDGRWSTPASPHFCAMCRYFLDSYDCRADQLIVSLPLIRQYS